MNYSEMLFNRDEKIIKIIEEKDKEIDKLTAESTEWEERTYCWQDRTENLQIVLDKIKEIIKKDRVYIAGERNLSHEIEELLEEIE